MFSLIQTAFAGTDVSVKVVCPRSCCHEALVACRLLDSLLHSIWVTLYEKEKVCHYLSAVISAIYNLVTVLNGEQFTIPQLYLWRNVSILKNTQSEVCYS